jgi:hypothetical protein
MHAKQLGGVGWLQLVAQPGPLPVWLAHEMLCGMYGCAPGRVLNERQAVLAGGASECGCGARFVVLAQGTRGVEGRVYVRMVRA